MLKKLKTWIFERISKIFFVPLIFVISLNVETFLGFFLLFNLCFFYIWFASGNIKYSLFFTLIILPLWFWLSPILIFNKFFWSIVLIITLLLFLEDNKFYNYILDSLIVFTPLIFFHTLNISLSLTLFLITLLNFFIIWLRTNLENSLFATLLCSQILIISIILPFDNLLRFVITGSLARIFWYR